MKTTICLMYGNFWVLHLLWTLFYRRRDIVFFNLEHSRRHCLILRWIFMPYPKVKYDILFIIILGKKNGDYDFKFWSCPLNYYEVKIKVRVILKTLQFVTCHFYFLSTFLGSCDILPYFQQQCKRMFYIWLN